ncbi:alpha/beta-hydrolase [Hyaloscypha variabilis]
MPPTHHTLLFRPSPSPHPISLPPHISRHCIPTPLGILELLSAQPPPSSTSPSPRKKALLFQHGGFGHATIWIPFLTYFSQHGHPCYALSLRGHGSSWQPSFFRLVWWYGKMSMAHDLQAAVDFVMDLECEARGGEMRDEDLVLVGHSAGGGLVQLFLDRGMGTVGGLVIMAGFPNFGGWGVYWNWVKLDPWFAVRFFFRDLGHPRSPLSETGLVNKAFFSRGYPVDRVREFEVLMPEYESLVWPLGMMLSFVDVAKVLKGIVGWKDEKQQRVLVIAGEKDTLMGVELMRRMAADYRQRFITLAKSFWRFHGVEEGASDLKAGSDDQCGISFEVIKGSGHHIQNDLYWEECAERILVFVDQL